MPRGPVCGNGSTTSKRSEMARRPPPSTPASTHGWLVVPPMGSAADFAGTATSSSAIQRGSSWKTHMGHFAQERLSERNSGELSCFKRV
jgi:hypothetical protein